MAKVDKDKLYELYIQQGKPMREVAQDLGISASSVFNYLHKFGIETREPHKGMLGHTHSKEVREKIGKVHKGKVVSEETKKKISDAHKISGMGHKKKRSDGYIEVYFPDHPKSNKNGYIMEHILKMEKLIGRHLKDGEVVHHANGVKTDNRYGNLILMTSEEHTRYHTKERHKAQNKARPGQQA